MKVKINKTIDTNKIHMHCNEHNIEIMSFLEAATNHPECAEFNDNYIFFDLFSKCLFGNMCPSFVDLVEGKHNDDWVRIEHEKMILLDKITEKFDNDRNER